MTPPEQTNGQDAGSGGEQRPPGETGDDPAQAVAVEPPQAFVIPSALAQATLDYLALQPYREVYALVRGFEALEPLQGGDEAQDGPA